MSTHETMFAALEAGEDIETTFYQRRCSVCKGIGKWGCSSPDRTFHLSFSCESCEGTGYQMCRRPSTSRPGGC